MTHALRNTDLPPLCGLILVNRDRFEAANTYPFDGHRRAIHRKLCQARPEAPDQQHYGLTTAEQAPFAALGTARKVIVAGSKITVLAIVGAPARVGSSFRSFSISALPFNLIVLSLKPAASSV